MNTLIPSNDFEYYILDSIYWNNFEKVISYINSSISGNETQGWVSYINKQFGTFDDGLFVSCGNGWVERDCFKEKLICSASGFDISQKLIEKCIEEANKIGMPYDYRVEDANKLTEINKKFNFIVNNGSIHHVAYIDQFTRAIASALHSDGIYIINDYTGPHRNQYSWEAWEAIISLNASIPKKYQINLVYPHMPTMLHTDPTEAIHSELQMGVARRYFDIVQEVTLGGGVAYTLLYNNKTLYKEQNTAEGKATIDRIMQVDQELTKKIPNTSLFTFAVCQKKKYLDQAKLDLWSSEEKNREALALNLGGRYYSPTALELIYNKFS